MPATPAKSVANQATSDVDMSGPKEQRSDLDESVIEELVTLARRTDAEITFIEDAQLLAPAKGVGAMLILGCSSSEPAAGTLEDDLHNRPPVADSEDKKAKKGYQDHRNPKGQRLGRPVDRTVV